ncbi:MAG: hypothetical protein K1X74_13205 [Pirellulales bacterium]|nr:hypothetical protein [Pirellulales bacterium]
MKTKLSLLCLALVVAAGMVFSGNTTAEDKKEFKATCPMSGKPAKEDCCSELSGKKVYFCCGNCQSSFDKDPKATAKVHLQWLETAQMLQVGCPLSGKPVNPDTMCDLGNAKVGFCCKNCMGKFQKASDEEKLAMCCEDISKGYTLQTECPLSGKPVKTDIFVEHEGKKVYFCCPGCPAGFKADPAKYTAKLPQFATEKK